ncbi:hypothetical protein FNF28_01706 [Cafeteria roenbergensis]|nr:hypothetical protein FNF28_01706 [Cafeteria roenbergensis]
MAAAPQQQPPEQKPEQPRDYRGYLQAHQYTQFGAYPPQHQQQQPQQQRQPQAVPSSAHGISPSAASQWTVNPPSALTPWSPTAAVAVASASPVAAGAEGSKALIDYEAEVALPVPTSFLREYSERIGFVSAAHGSISLILRETSYRFSVAVAVLLSECLLTAVLAAADLAGLGTDLAGSNVASVWTRFALVAVPGVVATAVLLSLSAVTGSYGHIVQELSLSGPESTALFSRLREAAEEEEEEEEEYLWQEGLTEAGSWIEDAPSEDDDDDDGGDGGGSGAGQTGDASVTIDGRDDGETTGRSTAMTQDADVDADADDDEDDDDDDEEEEAAWRVEHADELDSLPTGSRLAKPVRWR